MSDLAYQDNERLTIENNDLKSSLQCEQTKTAHLISENKRLSQQTFHNKYNEIQTSESLNNLVRDIIENKGLRPSEYLKLAEIISNGNLTIHPDTYKHIQESDKYFKQKDRFAQLIFKLAFDYRKLFFESGDTSARKVFSTSEYAAQESDTTTSTENKRIQSVRTVVYNGKEITMRQHLKIGVGTDASQCIRIYFFPDPEKKKIVIGYCGPHPLNSKGV